jgi:hypothetical protein
MRDLGGMSYVIAAPKRKHATASGASDSGAPTCSAVSGPMEVRSVDELRVHAQHSASRTRFWISPIVLRVGSHKCRSAVLASLEDALSRERERERERAH